MTKKSKIIYIVGSVAIGIIAALIIIFGLMLGGVINTRGNKLVISSASREFVYNGEERSDGGWQLVSGKLADGHKVIAEVTGKQKDAGSSLNYISATVVDKDGADVTSSYDIDYRTGTITVLARPVTLTTAGREKTYDGEELSLPEWEITKGSLVKGQEISVTMSAAITDAGEVENSAAAQIFDGAELTSDECKISQGHLAEGHSFGYFYTTASRTDAGVSINSYRLKIIDRGGEDVTYKYKINSSYGLLAVTAREITLTAGSAQKVYDGIPLTCNKYEITAGTLAEGQVCRVVVSGSNPGKAGSAENKILSASVSDAVGRDVTANYKITTVNGLLTVYPN